MTEHLDRLRSVDPAKTLAPQPDSRAERDLQVLLTPGTERPVAPVPGRSAPTSSLIPILVTAVVAAGVLVLTAAVFGVVRPRTPATTPSSGDGSSIAASVGPTPSLQTSTSCDPVAVYPLKCGTYRSTYGGKRITGDSGGPVRDPLELSFATKDGRLLLRASSGDCWSAEVPMRFVDGTSRRLLFRHRLAERAGAPRFTSSGCGSRKTFTGNWAYAFLHGTLRTADAETFGAGGTSVFFEYQGAAPIGQRQLARNDLKCVPAHVEPFACGDYRSTGGRGALAFLATRHYRMRFAHNNGELEASFYGNCNGISTSLQVDGESVIALGGSETTMLCLGTRGKDDDQIVRFFHGVLSFRQNGGTLTFTSPAGEAVFKR